MAKRQVYSREQVRAFVESKSFRIFIFVVILINAITIGSQASHDALSAYVPEFFDNLCLLIYIFEAALKLYAYRLDYFRSGWNVFDFAIVVISILSIGFLPSTVPIQLVRVIRLVRVTRMFKIVSLFSQMHVIVEAIGKSLSGVFWTAMLLGIIVYIYDVIGVVSFGAAFPGEFGHLGIGAITLIETALSGWPDVAQEVSAVYPRAYVYFISYVVCSALIVLNVVVGIIVDAIQGSAQAERNETARGHRQVTVKDHILLLGFNRVGIAILNELVEANRNQREMQHVVVLDNGSKDEIEETIAEEVGNPVEIGRTNILVRSGSIHEVEALKRCSIEESKAVIVNAETDSETVKAVMACTYAMNSATSCNSFSVAAVHDSHYKTPIMVAGKDDTAMDRLDLLPMQSILARIMVNASRQPGLPAVFTELFNFSGNEFYIIGNDPSFSRLHGKTIRDINLLLKNTTAVGIERTEEVIVDDPRSVVFEPGDSLILIEEDDDPLEVLADPVSPASYHIQAEAKQAITRALLLGNYSILEDVLCEYALYLPDGSTITVCDNSIDEDAYELQKARKLLDEHGIGFFTREVDIHNRHELRNLVEEKDPHCVLVLGDTNAPEPEEADDRLIEIVLYLRDYRENANHGFGIVSQINLEDNRILMSSTSADDYIVSRHFTALLMAQISQHRRMFSLINTILSSEGFEVYIKKASNYVPLGEEIDLFTVGAAVAERGDIFIGLRQKSKGRYYDPIVNPPKFVPGTEELARYTFEEDDYLVVLSEDMALSS